MLRALTEDAGHADCDALHALGVLAEHPAGEYGEAVEDAVFSLLLEHPRQIEKCWAGARNSLERLELRTTMFCSEFESIEKLYPSFGPRTVGDYVRRAAARCPPEERK